MMPVDLVSAYLAGAMGGFALGLLCGLAAAVLASRWHLAQLRREQEQRSTPRPTAAAAAATLLPRPVYPPTERQS